jgi:hypothetical protein
MVVKMEKITLPWANKFRELCNTKSDNDLVVDEFYEYMEEEEKKINEKMEKKNE